MNFSLFTLFHVFFIFVNEGIYIFLFFSALTVGANQSAANGVFKTSFSFIHAAAQMMRL